jgi:hypothetical protein
VQTQERRYQVLEPGSPIQLRLHTGRPVAEFHTMDLALQFARDQLQHGREVVVIDRCRNRALPVRELLGLDPPDTTRVERRKPLPRGR